MIAQNVSRHRPPSHRPPAHRRLARRAAAFALSAAAVLTALPAGAHPHVFIDTGVELVHDAEGRLVALRVSWTYDELFSLLLLEDLGLDADYDGVLTDTETEQLQGFDMDWPEGYEGDVYLEAAGQAVALGPPEPGLSALKENGMLTSTHTRPLARPVDPVAEPLVVKVYDPTFYTAYSILPGEVSSDAPGCVTAVFTPDLDDAYEQLAAALAEVGADVADPFVELDFPPVGDRFAEEIVLTCGLAPGKEGQGG